MCSSDLTIIPLGGGWWVNAKGKRTRQLPDGTWSSGAPVWRDGGWRTRRGRPTFKRPNGTWSAGVGVRYLRYRDLLGDRELVDVSDVLLAQRQAGDARREEIAARMAALRAILKLEIDSHVVWIDADDHGE